LFSSAFCVSLSLLNGGCFTFCGGKKVAANREITIVVPESHARRIEKIERRGFQEIAQEHLLNWFEDGRRKPDANKRQGISWHKEVYAAMMKQLGTGGASKFTRDAVYTELSKRHKDLVLADYKPGIEPKVSKGRRKSPDDRTAVQAPMLFPEQWLKIIEKEHPGKVSTWIKAVTQLRFEKLYKVQLPVQRGLREFLDR
jgi:hypothetical protein